MIEIDLQKKPNQILWFITFISACCNIDAKFINKTDSNSDLEIQEVQEIRNI